jgi:hypothetical protein
MSRMLCGDFGILCTGSNNNRHSSSAQFRDAFLPLGIAQQRPVPHGTAVDHGAHTDSDQFLAFADQRLKVRAPIA